MLTKLTSHEVQGNPEPVPDTNPSLLAIANLLAEMSVFASKVNDLGLALCDEPTTSFPADGNLELVDNLTSLGAAIEWLLDEYRWGVLGHVPPGLKCDPESRPIECRQQALAAIIKVIVNLQRHGSPRTIDVAPESR